MPLAQAARAEKRGLLRELERSRNAEAALRAEAGVHAIQLEAVLAVKHALATEVQGGCCRRKCTHPIRLVDKYMHAVAVLLPHEYSVCFVRSGYERVRYAVVFFILETSVSKCVLSWSFIRGETR